MPSFENESENFVEVVLVQRGDRAALERGTVLKAAVQQINRAAQENPKANLEAVATQYGLSPDDLDMPRWWVGLTRIKCKAASVCPMKFVSELPVFPQVMSGEYNSC